MQGPRYFPLRKLAAALPISKNSNKGATLQPQNDGNITGGSSLFPSGAGLLPTDTSLQAYLGWWDNHHAAQFVSKARWSLGYGGRVWAELLALPLPHSLSRHLSTLLKQGKAGASQGSLSSS